MSFCREKVHNCHEILKSPVTQILLSTIAPNEGEPAQAPQQTGLEGQDLQPAPYTQLFYLL